MRVKTPPVKKEMVKLLNKALRLNPGFTWSMNTDKIRQIYYAVLEIRGGNVD